MIPAKVFAHFVQRRKGHGENDDLRLRGRLALGRWVVSDGDYTGVGTSEAARERAANITFTEDSDLGGFHVLDQEGRDSL